VEARRLALARAGLLKPEWTGLPSKAAGRGKRAREAAHAIIRRFGYLQLDTVSVAGARSHALVLLSRLEGFEPALAEELLQAREPLFEYWGHEASWMPLELYPAFQFRREYFRRSPWYRSILKSQKEVARKLVERITTEGPIRSLDMEGRGSRGWWDLKAARRVAAALWSAGDLAIRERRSFQRSFDLTHRVVPSEWRNQSCSTDESFEILLLKALDGHGWAAAGTLAQTWRLRNCQKPIRSALDRLTEQGRVLPCALHDPDGRSVPGWIRPDDLELAGRLNTIRPRHDRGVLLSPFDPVLWDRPRLRRLFGFDFALEIFKPAHQRQDGYYSMPVLAGERLVARFDLKADRKVGRLQVRSCRFEAGKEAPAAAREAASAALARYADALALRPVGA
jgi:uncharacterized protein YcaQ